MQLEHSFCFNVGEETYDVLATYHFTKFGGSYDLEIDSIEPEDPLTFLPLTAETEIEQRILTDYFHELLDEWRAGQ